MSRSVTADHVQTVLDRHAEGTPYVALANGFLTLERSGDNPVCLLAEAAAATTGLGWGGIQSAVDQFRAAFVDTGRVTSFAELSALDCADDALVDVFGAERKRRVLLEAAATLAFDGSDEQTDLERLQTWAQRADIYRYEDDPIGSIAGVGPTSFQYLRMLAGVDTARPDRPVRQFLETLAAENDLTGVPVDTSSQLRVIASCEWLAYMTSYRLIELDQVAWWLAAEADERAAVVSDFGPATDLKRDPAAER